MSTLETPQGQMDGSNATKIGWHLWEIDLRFAPGLPLGWAGYPRNSFFRVWDIRIFIPQDPPIGIGT